MATVNGTSGNDTLTGTASADSLSGFAGDDTLNGLGAVDTLNGGTGNDVYIVTAGDLLVDAGGLDTVISDITWTLGAGFEHITLTGTSAINVTGNELGNFAIGNSGANFFNLRTGNDTIHGGGGNDRIDLSRFGTASYGDEVIDGGAGFDVVSFHTGSGALSAVVADLAAGTATGGGQDGAGSASLTSIEWVVGTDAFGDRLSGSAAAERFEGRGGNDTLSGMGGNDTLIGEAGQDTFAFASAPGGGNVDLVADFVSGTDKLSFDTAAFTAIGAPGNFPFGDARFVAGNTTSGIDPTDRIVYNTTTGNLYYDADGSGAGASVLVATLQGAPRIFSDDIVVTGQSQTNVIRGSSGNDSLTGGVGDDAIEGLGGNDTVDAQPGNDTLDGGTGSDSLVGGHGLDQLFGGDGNDTLDGVSTEEEGLPFPWESTADTMDGGLGDDEYRADNPNDILSDAGGVDTVIAHDMDWTLAPGFENLTINNAVSESAQTGIGNELDNRMTGSWAGNRLEGRGGNDTIGGSFTGGDTLLGQEGNDSLFASSFAMVEGGAGDDTLIARQDSDTLAGGSGSDTFIFGVRPDFSSIVTDFTSRIDHVRLDARVMPELGASGALTAADARFHAAAGATAGHDADDRLVYDTSTGTLYFDPDGNGSQEAAAIATFQSGGTAAPLAATDITIDNGSAPPTGGQTITGTAGHDSLTGTEGNESMEGLAGNDTIESLGGDDTVNGGDDDDSLEGGAGSDHFIGGGGNDTLDGWYTESGFESWDEPETMDGGLGDDQYVIDQAADVLIDAGGIDTVVAFNLDWTLAPGFENLTLANDTGESSQTGIGNELDNFIRLTWEGGHLEGRGGNDTIIGAGAQNFFNNTILGGDGNDSLIGGGDDLLDGGAGDDTLNGGRFVDTLTGGTGSDSFMLDMRPGESQGHRDLITDFTSGIDRLRLDARVMPELGSTGTLATGDARFHAAAGATAGHDADDRLVYDTSTGDLYFDPDGNGAESAGRIATLQSGAGAAPLAATDITIDNGSAPPPDGQTVTGTAGNDSLTGTNGNDTLDGLGGVDTMSGMLGDDTYVVTAGDVLQDSGGIETVMTAASWTLGAGFENITLTGTGNINATGNELGNLAIGNSGANFFNLRAGNDTIQAGGGNDRIDLSRFGTASYGDEVIDGGAGFDVVSFHTGSGALSAVVVDLAAGTATGGGQDGAGSASLTSIEWVVGTDAFGDRLSGSAAAERFEGRGGNDTLSGMGGNDTLVGEAGQDMFVFASAPGSGNVDLVMGFAAGSDEAAFDNTVFTALGADGDFAAGDARFAAGAGFTSGRDASDRIVYNTSTGNLYYDADGSGGGGAQLIATLQGNPTIAANDISVI